MAEKKKSSPRAQKRKSPKNNQPPRPTTESAATPGEDSDRSGYALRDERIEGALISGEHRDLLESYFGEALYDEMRTLAGRAQTARTRGGPRVWVLPGIMGSKLGKSGVVFDDTIWVDPLDIMAGRLRSLSLIDAHAGVSALGVLLTVYLKIKLKLKLAGFDTDFHPFDWRQDIQTEGRTLADRIRRETSAGPRELYLVAHSMGGLVARSAIWQLQETAEADKVRRLIMMGTPNFGSFSPVQVFSGDHSMVKMVAAVDMRNSEKTLVSDVFNTFPGLYQMLPAPQKYSGFDLYNPANWPPKTVAPRPELLSTAQDLHNRLATSPERFTLIAGINQETIVGVRREGDQFFFLKSFEGDGTVPLAFAQLEGVETYYIEESHGSLPNNGKVVNAVTDLLETGQSALLPTRYPSQRRGAPWEVRGDDLAPLPFDGRRGDQISAREIRHLLDDFAAPPKPARANRAPLSTPAVTASGEPIVVGRRRQQRLDLRLAFGSITQVDTRAVVLGLFSGVSPSGAARAIDGQLDGAITEFTERRILSAKVGDVFIMPSNRYRMGADIVVFAGLGSYDDLNAEVLRLVAENVARTLARTKVDNFATVLLSSGSGMDPSDVLSNLLTGFLFGIREGDKQGHLKTITLCESNRERFENMHRDLLGLTTTAIFDDVETTVEILELPPPPATVPRQVKYQAVDPVYLIVREMIEPRPQATDPALNAPFTVRASVLTAGFKATVVTDTIDVDAAALNGHLEVIETDEFDYSRLDEFGETLGKLVLPHLVRNALKGMQDRPMVVIHDARSSRVPWETMKIDGWAPAAGAGLSRKYEANDLTVAKWLEDRRLANQLSVLLIVNPTEDLPGAEAEGHRIRKILAKDPAVRIDDLWCEQATFSAVRAAFRSGKYDVVHYAGHAFFDPVRRSRSGILCHGHQVLSGVELARLEKLPALVFFNACEAGRVRSPRVRKRGVGTAQRLETNVGLAEAFLRAGIGNYIGTYWPVGDSPAKAFGEAFYQAIVRGESIGVALGKGRRKVRKMESVDWADYIHYGSPNFQIKRT